MNISAKALKTILQLGVVTFYFGCLCLFLCTDCVGTSVNASRTQQKQLWSDWSQTPLCLGGTVRDQQQKYMYNLDVISEHCSALRMNETGHLLQMSEVADLSETVQTKVMHKNHCFLWRIPDLDFFSLSGVNIAD